MADSRRKFDAAVHVIRSLPKSGAFQPSNEMMLKFYGYYKQAIEGPCNEEKPSFWDMVKKAKWEAWSKLGDTSKEEAMENYVNELKEVIRNMPETDQASQFISALEPFYKVAYKKEETAPPIFNRFRKMHHSTPSIKMNGHANPYIQENGNSDEPRLDTSKAGSIHNITGTAIKQNRHSNGDIQTTRSLDINEVNGIKPDLSNVTTDAVSDHVENEHSDVIVLSDSNNESYGNNDSNGNKDCDDDDDDDDDDDEDDDELFCDSLGPELLEEQIGREQMLHSGMLESVPEDVVPLNDRNLSSFSDVEILEKFDSKKNGGSDGETSNPHTDKIVHVHFEDLNTSQGEDISINQELPKEHGFKECVVKPNQQRASGSSDNRGLSRAAGSDGKQTHRNVQYSDRSSRYTERYRRRSQESDSDESPGRSDHNSSSEKDDGAIDKIADLLMEIQDNMKKILERLKRLETSLQQSQSAWFENYRPSKTFIFLILWPIIVNFLFKFLRQRFFKKR